MISHGTIVAIGLSQLVSWGITYYLVGIFGDAIAEEMGWTHEAVYGGFGVALLVMGAMSATVGRLIDHHGGRALMAAGSLLNAIGCIGVALCNDLTIYYAAWVFLGVGMRLTLYDAAFASLTRVDGARARRAITRITLLGGLASTAFWPLGHALTELLGWRGALVVYSGFALLTLPLQLSIPSGPRTKETRNATLTEYSPLARDGAALVTAKSLYAVTATLANFLTAGMAAHAIGILTGVGLAPATAVWMATLIGVGQSLARLCQVVFGERIHALELNLLACVLMLLSFAAGLFVGRFESAAIVLAFAYGAGNGLMTITRGTLPLVLFDHRTYGALVGRLIAPGFALAAAAPYAYAFTIQQFGAIRAVLLSMLVAATMFTSALILKLRFGRARRAMEEGSE